MTARERQLERRVTALERLVARVYHSQGLTDAQVDKMALSEATATGDPKEIQRVLRSQIARKNGGCHGNVEHRTGMHETAGS